MGLHHELWMTEAIAAWEQALAVYPEVVAAQGVDGLVELDTWYRSELPARIARRDPASIELDEMVEVTLWKMRRGAWRPRNLALVKSNAKQSVVDASALAFQAVETPRRALAALCRLDGVGPATASAVLGACHPDFFPFLDEVVGEALPELGVPQFTAPYYERYRAALIGKATALGSPWTAQEVGLALWAAAGGKLGAGA